MPTEPGFWWNWYVQLATTIATFLAVIVALFADWFRNTLFPPQLTLALVNARGAPPTAAFTVTTQGQTVQVQHQTMSRWYHVAVSNRRRMTPATEVQVCLLSVGIPNATGGWIEQSVGAVPLKVRNEGIVRPGRVIGPPVEWDLCSIFRDITPGSRPLLELQTVIAPTNLVTRTDQPHRVLLTLQARSIAADSDVLRLELNWDGQWSDDTDAMEGHFRITMW